MNLTDRAVTVGAYIMLDDSFLFAFGPNPQGDRLAVIRVGGHREPGETPWACAAREALEETSLQIEPVPAAQTLLLHEGAFEPVAWGGPAPQPWLVLPRGAAPDGPFNLMFLARASGTPVPAHEVNGLLLLRPDEVRHLCRQPTTLQQYLDAGGRAWMRKAFPPELILEPILQLKLLARLLEQNRV